MHGVLTVTDCLVVGKLIAIMLLYIVFRGCLISRTYIRYVCIGISSVQAVTGNLLGERGSAVSLLSI